MLSDGSKKAGKRLTAVFNMLLIDTDIIIWLLRGNKKYVNLIQRLKDKYSLTISVLTITEVYKNVFPAEFVKTEEVINEFVVWQITSTIAKQGGLYWQQYSKKLKKLHILDCLIAGTVKEHGLTLLTLNTRHFPMDDIKVVDPVKKGYK